MQASWSVPSPEEGKGVAFPAAAIKVSVLWIMGLPWRNKEKKKRSQRGTFWEGRKQRTGQGQFTWGLEVVFFGFLEAWSDVET